MLVGPPCFVFPVPDRDVGLSGREDGRTRGVATARREGEEGRRDAQSPEREGMTAGLFCSAARHVNPMKFIRRDGRIMPDYERVDVFISRIREINYFYFRNENIRMVCNLVF